MNPLNALSLFDMTPCANGDRVLAAAEAGDPKAKWQVTAWCRACPVAELCTEILGGPVATPPARVMVLPTRRATETTSKEVAA